MASTCIASCVEDSRIPVRATYINLYKWPESDVAFVRSVSSNGRSKNGSPPFLRSASTNGRLDGPSDHPRVVNSMSCRQLYLRSYTFSRKESVPEKTRKCIGRVRERVVAPRKMRKSPSGGRGGSVVIRRAKEVSCTALTVIFRRLLSCTTKVDVVG